MSAYCVNSSPVGSEMLKKPVMRSCGPLYLLSSMSWLLMTAGNSTVFPRATRRSRASCVCTSSSSAQYINIVPAFFTLGCASSCLMMGFDNSAICGALNCRFCILMNCRSSSFFMVTGCQTVIKLVVLSRVSFPARPPGLLLRAAFLFFCGSSAGFVGKAALFLKTSRHFVITGSLALRY